jgi:hypothetical protein
VLERARGQVQSAIFVRSAGEHYSVLACLTPSADTLHAYHLDARNGASGGHTVWAATVLTPFVHTLAKHGFALRVRDELVASRQEALSVDELWEEMQSRLDDSALELSEMVSVDVEAEAVGSNAGGAASVYATEMVVRMLKQAAAKSELNPAEVRRTVTPSPAPSSAPSPAPSLSPSPSALPSPSTSALPPLPNPHPQPLRRGYSRTCVCLAATTHRRWCTRCCARTESSGSSTR